MNKIFLDTIIQHGGKHTDSEKVVILNKISKYINKKMKILEYSHGIKLKLSILPMDNSDCIPKKIGFQTFVNIDGPGQIKGQIPIYTETNINYPTPQIYPITTILPINPYVPYVGVPGFALNPFGETNTLNERINKASSNLKIIGEINDQLEQLKKGLIEKSKIDKKYFDFIDLDEPEPIDGLDEFLNITNIANSKDSYSNL